MTYPDEQHGDDVQDQPVAVTTSRWKLRREALVTNLRSFWADLLVFGKKRGAKWQLAKLLAVVALLPPLWWILEWYEFFFTNLCLTLAFVVFFTPRLRTFLSPLWGKRGFKWLLVKALVVVVILTPLWIYLTAPWFYGIWFFLLYMNPGFWVYLLIVVPIFWRLVKAFRKHKVLYEPSAHESSRMAEYRTSVRRNRVLFWRMLGLGFLFLFGLVAYILYAPDAAKASLAQQTPYVKMDALPPTTSARFLPLQVAETCATSRLNDSQVVLGDIDPIDMGGELQWVAPLEPNGFWNTLGRNTSGVEVIRPDVANGCALQRYDAVFEYGEGMILTDEVWAQLVHRNYWADIPEVFYQIDTQTNEVIGVAPYMRFELNWPLLYRTPVWGGVFVIHPDGNIEDLTPEQAQNDSRLAGQRLVPENFAKKIAEARAYKNGVWNAWFSHVDQTQVPDIPGSKNQMPFLLPTQNGPVWSTVFEPYGRTTGVYEIMNIDARTGAVSVFRPSDGTNYIGVNRAYDRVVATFPGNNWVNGESGTNLAIEPRPLVKGTTLYWQHTLTNRTYAFAQSTTLTNAVTGQVIVVCNADELNQFLAGTYPGKGSLCVQAEPGAQAPGSSPSPGGQPVPGDLGGLTDQQLIDLGRRILDEQQRRLQPTS